MAEKVQPNLAYIYLYVSETLDSWTCLVMTLYISQIPQYAAPEHLQ